MGKYTANGKSVNSICYMQYIAEMYINYNITFVHEIAYDRAIRAGHYLPIMGEYIECFFNSKPNVWLIFDRNGQI